MGEMADRILAWLMQLPTPAVYLLVVGQCAVENVFPPVPSDMALALGAFLSQRGATSAGLLGLLAWMANVSTSAGMYFFGRHHGRRLSEGEWLARLIPPEAVAALAEAYRKYGVVGIFFSRFVPGLRVAVTPFAGMVGVSPVRALVPAGLATALWYIVLVQIGATIASHWEDVKGLVERANVVLGLVGLGATVAIGLWMWRHARRARRAAGTAPPRP